MYLSAPTKALINLCSWHLWTNNKLIVKQIRWVSWPKCLVARWSALLKLMRKKRLSHSIVWDQQLNYLFNNIYRLTTTGTLWPESSDDRRDPLTKDLWWMISMRWRHDQSKSIIRESKDLIDTNPLTHPQTQTTPKKKNQSDVSWYSNRPWLCPVLLFLHQHVGGYRQSFVSQVFCIQCLFFFHLNWNTAFQPNMCEVADKCDGLFTRRCLNIIMYNLHHVTFVKSICHCVNVIVTQYCTACVYGLMGNKVQLKPIFHFWIMTKPDVTTGTGWIGLSGRNWLFGPYYAHSQMPMFRLCQRYKTMHVFVFHCVHLFY